MVSKILRFAALIFIVGLVIAKCTGGPLDTKLPLDLADIPKIQPQLDKLKSDERDLVLAYLARSKGDVMPAKFADPDAPLTARTFREAIKLQKEYSVKFAAQQERANALRAKRDEAYAPLRQAVAVAVMQREIMGADQAAGRAPVQGRAINDRATLVVTYRLHNRSQETVTQLKGSVTVRSESDPESLMGLASCWIEHSEPISTGGVAEVRCASRGEAGEAARKFVDLPESALRVTWEPKSITLGSGTVLHGPD